MFVSPHIQIRLALRVLEIRRSGSSHSWTPRNGNTSISAARTGMRLTTRRLRVFLHFWDGGLGVASYPKKRAASIRNLGGLA